MGRTTPRCLLSALLAAAIIATGCGSDDSDDETTTTQAASTESASESDSALVGEWVAVNECQALADALAEAGLEEFTVKMAKGAELLPPGKPDPSDPCKGSMPLEHSHAFSGDGTFNSYDENGQEVDFGTYEITGDGSFTLSRPPFESEVEFKVDGDTAEFELVVPDCQDKQCQTGAALGIATFFPGSYERVK
jgi:hypothetical protein